MKKKIVVLLIMLLFAVCSISFAESEITFVGVPWLSDEGTTMQILNEKGILGLEYKTPVFTGETGAILLPEETLGYFPVKNDTNKEVNFSISLAGKTRSSIAGAVIKDIILTYANDKLSSRLVSVSLAFCNESYEEIIDKLTRVYGKGKDNGDEDFRSIVWIGDNNSAVVLYTENEGYTYQLVYGRTDAEEILKECLETITATPDPDDVSGL